jgi:hypothetical protein
MQLNTSSSLMHATAQSGFLSECIEHAVQLL